MTIENDIYVRLASDGGNADKVLKLYKKAKASLARAGKLPPGDRTEAVRFESLHAAIDQIANKVLLNGGEHKRLQSDTSSPQIAGACVLTGQSNDKEGIPSIVHEWLDSGDIAVRLSLPHFAGETPTLSAGKIRQPMKRWSATEEENNPIREVLRQRFEDMIQKALTGVGEGAIQPSGVQNSALTEGLWKYVRSESAGQGIKEVPVTYRDGSQGPRFPLCSLKLANESPDTKGKNWMKLRFALMSMRHVEMDAEVDGAWLRNVKISQRREAGLTDQIVYETSLRQFEMLTKTFTHADIHLYQVGLEPAIIGFYRALTRHLIKKPGSVIVRPMYYRENADFEKGQVWAIK